MAKPRWRETEKAAPSEQLPCLVVKATADGYVVGHALVSSAEVKWLSPTHSREWLETRPRDVVLSAEKWANEDGSVTLKPKRVAKGTPVLTKVGMHVVFGEQFDSAAHRAKGELARQMQAVLKARRSYWRHLCAEQQSEGVPVWFGVPTGEKCEHCGKEQPRPKASAA